MIVSENNSVGQTVAENYKAAEIFQEFGIDFCCRGNRTIAEVCEKNHIETKKLIDKLNETLAAKSASAIDYKAWPLDLLADYIEKTHHRYVEKQIPILNQYLAKICKVHGANNPELHEIFEAFKASAGELTMHMKKEELVLFPFVRKMVEAKNTRQKTGTPHFGTVQNPIQAMMNEHDVEGVRFREIAALSNNYTPPAEACNTYRVAYALLKEFEEDLHLHIHLENNILFPGAIALEKELK